MCHFAMINYLLRIVIPTSWIAYKSIRNQGIKQANKEKYNQCDCTYTAQLPTWIIESLSTMTFLYQPYGMSNLTCKKNSKTNSDGDISE